MLNTNGGNRRINTRRTVDHATAVFNQLNFRWWRLLNQIHLFPQFVNELDRLSGEEDFFSKAVAKYTTKIQELSSVLLSAPGESPSVIGVVVLFSFWRHSSPFLTFCEACYPKVSSLARTKARWRHGGDFVLCLAGHLFTTNLGGIARTLDHDLRYSAFNFDSTTLCSSIHTETVHSVRVQ